MTVFFGDLLLQHNFPYKSIDLTRSYDWSLMEELKERFCTLNEVSLMICVYYCIQL
jgi:actin-related protein 8